MLLVVESRKPVCSSGRASYPPDEIAEHSLPESNIICLGWPSHSGKRSFHFSDFLGVKIGSHLAAQQITRVFVKHVDKSPKDVADFIPAPLVRIIVGNHSQSRQLF